MKEFRYIYYPSVGVGENNIIIYEGIMTKTQKG